MFSNIEARTISIGTLIYNPPFEVSADQKDHFLGFDIEIMAAICLRIQSTCHFKPLTFAELFVELLAKKIDLALGAISITKERQESFLFSLPYLASNGQFITTIDSDVNTIEDIRRKRIGLVQGTLFKALVFEKFGFQANVIEYPTLSGVFQAMAEGKVDVLIADTEAVKYWVTNNAMFKLVGDSIPIGIGYGIMANKDSSDLIKQINEALLDMETDGSYLKIYKRYFSPM
nr:transporter substrate-binding domain-containing protein [Legionella sp. PL877]